MENKVFVVLPYKFCVVCSYVFFLGLSLNSHSDFEPIHTSFHNQCQLGSTFSLHFIGFSGPIHIHASHQCSVSGQTMNFPNPFSVLTDPCSQFIEFPLSHLPISQFIKAQPEHLCLWSQKQFYNNKVLNKACWKPDQ